MPTERNRWDLPREYENYREQIQRIQRDQDRLAVSRDDEEIYRLQEDTRQQSPFLRYLAFGVLSTSLTALATRKVRPTDTALRIIGGFTGLADRAVNHIIHAGRAGAVEYLRNQGKLSDQVASALLKASREQIPQIRHLEIAQASEDVMELMRVLRNPNDPTYNNSVLQQLVQINKDRITNRFAAGSQSIGHIQELTVGKLMSLGQQRLNEIFRKETIQSIRAGSRLGLLSDDLVVGAGVYWDPIKDQIVRTPTLRGHPKVAHWLANQIQIPFTGIKFGDIIDAPLRHLFGQGAYAGLARSPVTGRPGAVIGGELFDVTRTQTGTAQFVSQGTGYKIGTHGVMAEAQAARLGQLGIQHHSQYTPQLLDEAHRQQKPVRSFFQALSELVGVGPQYRTQNAIIAEAYNMPRRVLRGDPTVKSNIPESATTFHGSLLQQIGDDLNIDVLTGQKLSFSQRQIQYKPTVTLSKKWQALGPIDKLKAIFGGEQKVVYLDPNAKDALGRPIKERIIKRAPGAGTLVYGSRPRLPGEEFLDESGKIVDSIPINQFAYKTGTSALYDVAHYMTNRLNALIGATAGIGFRPSQGNITGVVKNFAKIYGIYGAAQYGMEGLRYLNYLFSLPGGYAPSDALLDAYSVGRTSLQYARELTGVSPLARYTEDIMPGSVEGILPASLRTIAPAALGLYKKSIPGTLAGLAAGVFLGPGLTETPEETADILSGEQLVPIRRGRYWWLGKQPFEGGRTSYYAPGIVARLRSDYKFTNTLYGDEAEYFRKVSQLPNPTNLFGFLTDSNYLQEKHRFDRPYPQPSFTGSSFGPGRPSNEKLLYGSYGPPAGAATSLGYSHLEPVLSDYQAAGSGRLADRLNQLTELGGIYKFALWNLSGLSDLYAEPPAIADPAFMTSNARAFFDEQLGGMFGMSELYRRFVTSDEYNRQRNAYNPLPNTMDNWLPGSRSQFGGDTDYHIDFTTGDPYAKLPHGEFRLPGEARERLYRLHSGTPGVYDPIDRFLVLADVAPYSDAYKHYRALADMWRKAGVMDDYWSKRIDTAKEQVKEKMQRYQIYYRKFTGMALPYKMVEGPDYNLAERAIGGTWETFTHDIIPRVGISVPILGPLLANKMMAQRDPLEQYLKTEVYDTDEYDWAQPWPTIVRPMFEQLKATDPFTATAGGGITGYLFGANPLAKFMLATAGAAFFGSTSTLRAVETGQFTGGYVPDYVEERRQFQEYFDYLTYAKYRRLENQAQVLGNRTLADYFTDMKERTVASLNYDLPAWQFNQAAMRALPTRERAFFQDFINAAPEERSDILQYLPEYLKPVYQAAWAKAGDQRFSYKDMQMDPDERAARYLSQYGMPDNNWAGWRPDINMRSIQVKTAMAMGNSIADDFHRLNLFQTDIDRTREQFSDIDLDLSDIITKRPGLRQDITQVWRSELLLNGVSDIDIQNDLANGLENSITWDLTQDREIPFFSMVEDILRG